MSKPLSEMSWSELVDEVIRMQQRNADLAAHVEQGKDIVQELLGVDENPGEDPYAVNARAVRAETWLMQAPETSLARLITEKQAEAFDELAGDLALNADNARENGYTEAADVMQDASDYALTKAEIRRQAGGDV